MEITKTQLNYIMAVKRLTGGQVTLTHISEYLGVKKPTASVTLRKLEENGYIVKYETADSNSYYLTKKSWVILEELEREKFEFMSLFNDFVGLDYDICDKEYRSLCGLFSREFIRRLAAAREVGYKTDNGDKTNNNESFSGIPYGQYKLPFQVVQCAMSVRSMGDKGFVHPAILVINKDRQDILLESKKIYYKSQNNQTLHGELNELCYLDHDIKWIPAEREGESTWIIPFKQIMCKKDNYGRLSLGVVKIKARATTTKMPQSIAEITFNFEMLERY